MVSKQSTPRTPDLNKLNSSYMMVLDAIDSARKYPTDGAIGTANKYIDNFMGQFRLLGNNPPSLWKEKFERIAPFVPNSENPPIYQPYKDWRNMDPNAPPDTYSPWRQPR